MTFSYTIAEYRCTKCSNTRSEHSGTMSFSYVIAAFLAALALSFVLFRTPWKFPWYYFFCIFAGELLLLFVAGFPLSLFKLATGAGSITRRCPACGAQMTFRGRHITKSQTPRLTDYVLLFLFIAANVCVWLILIRSTGK
jgi:DNA-directed RNA polymerase subunit RPC12/RpoP